MYLQAHEIRELATAELDAVSGGGSYTPAGTGSIGCSTILNPLLAGTNNQADLGPLVWSGVGGVPYVVL